MLIMAAPETEAHLYATPTQGQFVLSDAVIAVIVGPMGEGKSLAGVLSLFAHLERNRQALMAMNIPLECAIIRDTHENIKRSVAKVFDEFFAQNPGIKYAWRNDQKHLTIFTTPKIECDLFGIDDLNSVTKLQGSAYSVIWIDDPVPYTDANRANAGISEDTFNAALVRCARQAGMREGLSPRLQISTNLPDEDHWFGRRLLEPPDGPVHPKTPMITKKVFHIPFGENVFLSDISRQATMAAYMDDRAAYERFVEGRVATRYAGIQVAKNFNERWHVSSEELFPEPGHAGFISFDSWTNPAAVLGQQLPDSRIVILDVCTNEVDIRELIQNRVIPLLGSPRWKDTCRSWRYMGDFSMQQPDQSNIESSSARVVEESFADEVSGEDAYFEPGPSTWDHILTGMLRSLRWTVRGEPAILICKVNCKPLIAGLRGRWQYPINKSGIQSSSTPVKNQASHICDAFANACCVLSNWSPPGRYGRARSQQRKQRQQKRARSYAA